MAAQGARRTLFYALFGVSLTCAGCSGGAQGALLLAPGEDPFFYGVDRGASLGPSEPIAEQDDSGNPIRLPRGASSFADEVVDYKPGRPEPVPEGQLTASILGPPDYVGGPILDAPRALTLGTGGSITLRFTDNALVDVDGPDLYVFESGPDVEATLVDISADGQTWIAAGRASGHASSLDIAPVAAPGQIYSYVRLTDDPAQGHVYGDWPGADIDAVGAVGAVEKIELSGEVLFEHDSDALRSGAAKALDGVLARIEAREGPRVTVLGHTDSTGDDAYNLDLSRRRAEAAARYLEEHGVARAALTVKGHGESRPVAENGSPEGRRKNRRVEIVIIGNENERR
jgi:outer membrane protein OmpA-like peptidoglycan-associated protein